MVTKVACHPPLLVAPTDHAGPDHGIAEPDRDRHSLGRAPGGDVSCTRTDACGVSVRNGRRATARIFRRLHQHIDGSIWVAQVCHPSLELFPGDDLPEATRHAGASR